MPEVIHPPDEAQLIARALRAWGYSQHGSTLLHREATVQHLAGRNYVVLPRLGDRPIVYRIHNDGQLRQMHKRIPPELTAGYDEVDE